MIRMKTIEQAYYKRSGDLGIGYQSLLTRRGAHVERSCKKLVGGYPINNGLYRGAPP